MRLSASGLLAAAILMAGFLLPACGGGDEKDDEGARPAETSIGADEQVQGVSDTEIILGSHYPLSQTSAAVYATIAGGMAAYFEDVNSRGGVHGRKITFLVEDDHYNPADAMEAARRLVEQKGVFAIVGGLGDATHFTVTKYLEEKGIPDLFFAAGMPEMTDPVVKSRFGGMTPDYYSESKAGAKYIAEHYAGKKLGILTQGDEAGERGQQMIADFLQESDSGIEIVGVEKYDLTAVDVTAQAQRLKAEEPDLVALLAHPGVAGAFIKVARETLAWHVPFYTPSISSNELTVILAGKENAEGLISPLYLRTVVETDLSSIQEHLRIMKQYRPQIAVTNMTLYGQALAELIVKALDDAGPDLTPDAVIQAAEGIRDFCCTACLAPLNYSAEDHRGTETFTFGQVKDGNWVALDETVSYESTPGKTTTCPRTTTP